MIGREAAAQLIAKHKTSDLRTLVKKEGLVVKTRYPWKARFEEAFVYPFIFVPRYLSRPAFRSRVAHALGHHLLHAGNQVWMRGFDRIWNLKQEQQAQEFASYLLIPKEQELFMTHISIETFARMYAVEEELVRVRGRAVES